MRGPEFKRACRDGRTARDRWSLYIIGFSAALLLPLLLLDLGLLTHLVLGDGQHNVSQGWVLEVWTSGRVADWPLLGDARSCLMALVTFGVVVGMLEVWALWLLNRAVQRAALGAVLRIEADVHRQAYRIGVDDLLGDRRTAPERLLTLQLVELHRGLLRWWQAVPFAVVALVSVVLFALAINIWLALVVLLSVVLVRLIYQGVASRAGVDQQRWAREAAARQEQLLQNMRLTPLAAGYGLTDAPGVPFRELLGRYRLAALRAEQSRASLGPTLLALIVWALAGIVLVLGLSRYVTVSGTVVLAAASLGAYFPAARLYRLARSLGPAERAAKELFAYLRREPAVRQVDQAKAIDRVSESIQLDQVTLADSAGLKLLDRVSLTIPAGRRVAILASDRTAGMALAGLFVRFYDPAAGRVMFDGFDIAQATLDTVRGQALLVSAEGMLFEGTVSENISCGDAGFTTLQVTDAAKQARANSFIVDLPKGFGTRIGGDEVQLDASQAFRIALARALLRNPSVLVVAEPDQIEDPDSLTLIGDALRIGAQDRTMIVLPAHLESLQLAHEVVVLHEGHVVAMGPHEQLLRSCELYRHLNYVRFHAFRNIR